MSRALKGSHYCIRHQGNHSHYAEDNCEVCTLQRQRDVALEEAERLAADEIDIGYEDTPGGDRRHVWIARRDVPDYCNKLREQSERRREALAQLIEWHDQNPNIQSNMASKRLAEILEAARGVKWRGKDEYAGTL